MNEIIFYIVKLNGIYDILCALCIVKVINIPYLDTLHLSMIKNSYAKNELFTHFFAYWIFTYGMIRLTSNNILIAYSYFMEAIVFLYELYKDRIYLDKGLFVILTSLVLGVIVLSK